MKLLNHSVKYLSIALFILVTLWSVVFYFSMFSQVKGTMDEELENHKRLIIQNVIDDPEITLKDKFDENLYTLQKINSEKALIAKDTYSDTKIYMQDADDETPELEPVRMLSTVFKANESFYQLKIANPIIEQNDLIKALLWNVMGLYIVLILGIVYINNITLKKIWQPFYILVSELKSFKIEKLKPLSLEKTKIKEFNDLQRAVNLMAENSLKVYAQQKEFLENASHELQTPLAIASNKLELLFENETLPENQAEKITETYQILQRLIKLNKSLLLLSKIENKQFSEIEEIIINEIVKQNLNELEGLVNYRNIKLDFTEEAKLTILIDKTHANILISNLFKNAIFHNVDNGIIEVGITANRMSISNTGNPIPLDKNKIFNRFYKETTSNKNTGLGLAIVKTIANLYDAKINYHFNGKKHCFELIFD